MCNAIAPVLLSDAQPILSSVALVCLVAMIPWGLEYPWGQLGSAVTPGLQAVTPPSSWCAPSLLTAGLTQHCARH